MRNEKITFKMLFWFVILLSGHQTIYAQWNGTGTEDDPFLIKTVDDLATLSFNAKSNNYSGQYFRLENDLDLNVSPWNSGAGWEPIGLNTTRYFGGFFDGNKHVIRNLYINFKQSSFYDQYFGGLFGAITDGSVKDLGLENINITIDLTDYMYIHLGGLVGRIQGAVTVSGCYSTGKINATGTGAYFFMTGGLAGYTLGRGNDHIIFSKCYSTCNISGIGKTTSPLSIGGLIGTIDTATTEDCYATGKVTGETVAGSMRDLKVGGLLGNQNFEGIIRRSYATGNISAIGGGDVTGKLINYAGGVIGYTGAALVRKCWLNNCVAINNRINGLSTGRIMGGCQDFEWLERNSNFAYDNLIVNEAVIEEEINKDSQHGENATKEELYSKSFYTSTLSWDTENVWNIYNGKSLPYLSWQSAPLFIEIASTKILQGTFQNSPIQIKIYNEEGIQVEGTVNTTEDDGRWYFIPAESFEMGTPLTILNYEEGKAASYPVEVTINTQSSNIIGPRTNNQIVIYPNPVKDLLHINTNSEVLQSVTLYNRSGNILFKKNNINSSSLRVDMNEFVEGIYLLEVNTTKGKTTHKIFKRN